MSTGRNTSVICATHPICVNAAVFREAWIILVFWETLLAKDSFFVFFFRPGTSAA